jgi:uncharacterized protein (UPF0276 family)
MMTYPVEGVGLGLRREQLTELRQQDPMQINFMELAPENWLKMGGRRKKELHYFCERYSMLAHGLSLSIGSPLLLDLEFLAEIKKFLEQNNITYYSEHLSYCSDSTGQLYDLLPIPFTEEAVHYVAGRIRQVQDFLERRIAMENASYYAAPGQEMTEVDFINAVLSEADCDLLLDVNNVYVNSINHQYDAEKFLQNLPEERIAYIHIAGHYQEKEDLLIDTHGVNVIDPVWNLLRKTYQLYGVIPTLLERDNNVPALSESLLELDIIHQLQNVEVGRG